MRKVLFSLAVAAGALAIATPASAQWGPQPQRSAGYYGNAYGAPYGNAYGYQNNYGQIRVLQARINQLQRMINQLDRRDVIRNREASRLRESSRAIERRLQRSARYGLSPRESYDIQRRVGVLEQRINRVLYEGRHWQRNDRRWNDFWQDRDHDGRNDRYEDDRGTRHDRRR